MIKVLRKQKDKCIISTKFSWLYRLLPFGSSGFLLKLDIHLTYPQLQLHYTQYTQPRNHRWQPDSQTYLGYFGAPGPGQSRKGPIAGSCHRFKNPGSEHALESHNLPCNRCIIRREETRVVQPRTPRESSARRDLADRRRAPAADDGAPRHASPRFATTRSLAGPQLAGAWLDVH